MIVISKHGEGKGQEVTPAAIISPVRSNYITLTISLTPSRSIEKFEIIQLQLLHFSF